MQLRRYVAIYYVRKFFCTVHEFWNSCGFSAYSQIILFKIIFFWVCQKFSLSNNYKRNIIIFNLSCIYYLRNLFKHTNNGRFLFSSIAIVYVLWFFDNFLTIKSWILFLNLQALQYNIEFDYKTCQVGLCDFQLIFILWFFFF